MDHPYHQYRNLYQDQHSDTFRTTATYLAYVIAAVYAIHQILVYYDYPILSLQEIFWNAVVYIIPAQILLDGARRQELKATDMLSQTHAAKSEALRRVLGIGGQAVLQKLPAEGIMRRMSSAAGELRQGSSGSGSDAPPGLGNWDNSCYQNSVLQGLASLDSLKEYLGVRMNGGEEGEDTTTSTLQEFVGRLNDRGNNGRHLWTPAKLKNMSSWQQQDAQEYYSKVLDELDKEALKAAKANMEKPGLETIVEEAKDVTGEEGQETNAAKAQPNPLDGLLAQRVACTRCGYSEGLSMIPFNCLTLPLGSNSLGYDIQECLDEYTKLEEISDVECGKCTLLRAEQQLNKMLPDAPTVSRTDGSGLVDSKTLSLPPELRAQAFQRLSNIQKALDEDDFADRTLHDTCQIPKKAKVSSTKTRQAVIGRAPHSLVMHVNRSVFDEMTGAQRKNYASVRWPMQLDLGDWVLPTEKVENEDAKAGATDSLLQSQDQNESVSGQGLVYKIKAVVTHYGRHENGHYICYKQYPVHKQVEQELDDVDEGDEVQQEDSTDDKMEMRWWRLSDEDVTTVSEGEVLKQGGVFMLFYERESMPESPSRILPDEVAAADAVGTAIELKRPEERIKTETTLENEEGACMLEAESNSKPAIDLAGTAPGPSPAPSSSMEPETDASVFDTQPATPATTVSSNLEDDMQSTDATTEDESETETSESDLNPPTPQQTPPMRTAHSQRPESPPGSTKKDGFGVGGQGWRAMAAT